MSPLHITIRDNRTAFRPGEEIEGTVSWSFAGTVPEAMELRLFWFTRGKGTQDVGVYENVRRDALSAEEVRRFRFRLPHAPYSFSGKYVSLTWALELVTEPPGEMERLEIILSPSGTEIEL